MSTRLSTSRAGCCAAARMRRMSLRKPCFARAASFVVFRAEMRAPGCCRIVRNTCYSWLEKNRPRESMVEFDEELHRQPVATPESIAMAVEGRERLTRALETLPPRYRELLVLRELEGCSYKEIAAITSIPLGTVMSSLSRARRQLHCALVNPGCREAIA